MVNLVCGKSLFFSKPYAACWRLLTVPAADIQDQSFTFWGMVFRACYLWSVKWMHLGKAFFFQLYYHYAGHGDTTVFLSWLSPTLQACRSTQSQEFIKNQLQQILFLIIKEWISGMPHVSSFTHLYAPVKRHQKTPALHAAWSTKCFPAALTRLNTGGSNQKVIWWQLGPCTLAASVIKVRGYVQRERCTESLRERDNFKLYPDPCRLLYKSQLIQ